MMTVSISDISGMRLECCSAVSLMLTVMHVECRKSALCAECHYAKCHYAECHYAECHYTECHYAECHYAKCRYPECRGAVEVTNPIES
jgi:hypothetical protein